MKVVIPQSRKSEIPISMRTSEVTSLEYLKRIETLGPAAVLEQLANERSTMNVREQSYLQKHLKAAFACATAMKQEPELWKKFCSDPIWKDVTRPPKANETGRELFYSYVRLFGTDKAGRSKASHYFKTDQQAFELGLERDAKIVDHSQITLMPNEYHVMNLTLDDLAKLKLSVAEGVSAAIMLTVLAAKQPTEKSTYARGVMKRRPA